MKFISQLIIFIVFSAGVYRSQEKILATSDTISNDLKITTCFYQDSEKRKMFRYRVQNLNSQTVYFDTVNLFISYFLKPINTVKNKYISFEMSKVPLNGTTTVFPLKQGKSFEKNYMLDSTDFNFYLFEFVYFRKSELKKIGAIKERNNYSLHNELYIMRSRKISIQ